MKRGTVTTDDMRTSMVALAAWQLDYATTSKLEVASESATASDTASCCWCSFVYVQYNEWAGSTKCWRVPI